MSDLKFAIRQLLKEPGYTLVAIITLALGIGSTTAIYSVVNTALINPVPGPHSERLMHVGEWIKPDRGDAWLAGVTPPTLQLIRENQNRFEGFTWAITHSLGQRRDGFPVQIPGTLVAPNYFSFLKVAPLIGRGFADDEHSHFDSEGEVAGETSIILSHSLWMSQYGGDRNVLGQTIQLSGRSYTIIGVMPPHFKYPWGGSQFWLPMEDPKILANRAESANYQTLVRLKPNATLEQTQAMLNSWSSVLRNDQANDTWQGRNGYGRMMRLPEWTLKVRPLQEIFTDAKLQRTLLGLLGAILFVLLIVCANITNLTLARTERRQQELAIRGAMGAGRSRIARQLLTESLLLAFLGGIAGLLVTSPGMTILTSLLPHNLPQLSEISIDSTVLAVSLLVSLGTGLVFGFAPAWCASRIPVNEALKESGARTSTSRSWRTYRGSLVAIQVALALVLLTGAGLMIRSVIHLLNVNPGFDPENLVRIQLFLPWEKYGANPESKNPIVEQLHERLTTIPGVEVVGISKDDEWTEAFELEGGRAAEFTLKGCGVGSSDLFRAMRIPILEGRTFNRTDISPTTKPVVINEELAKLCWPGRSPVGMKFSSSGAEDKIHYEVIGLVANTRPNAYNENVVPTFYRPFHEMRLQGMPLQMVIRTAIDSAALLPSIRDEIRAIEPDMGSSTLRVVRQELYDATQSYRTYMLYLISFAGVGVFLAALGIYGTLAYSVARRSREIGIRMAVGARQWDVLKIILLEGGRVTGIGILAGLVASYWLTQFIESQLFQVSPVEPVVCASVVTFLALVALLAALVPARRATKLDPMKVLRHE